MGQMWEAECIQLELTMIAQKGDCGWKNHILPGNNFPLPKQKS